MAMSDRQIQKEILRIKKEIDLLESQIQSGLKSKAEKEQENKRLEEDIKKQEDENLQLAEELTKQTGTINELDEEFKENQLKAGRIRKEIGILVEGMDKMKKEEIQKRAEIERMLAEFEAFKKKIKEEKHQKETTEYNLRKTNAKVAEIQANFWSKFVTQQIRKKAKKAGKDLSEIEKSKSDIEEYEAKVRESRLAQVKKEGVKVDDDTVVEDVDVANEALEGEKSQPKPEEEKKEKSGLDLDF